jgi:hypothetical protein
MIETMSMILYGAPLELDKFDRPVTVGPCLSDGANKRCGTAEKVGYSCVGCIGAKFPLNKPLFRQMERPKKEPQGLPQYENVIFASRLTVRRGWGIGEWPGELSRWI